ncbi:hypothetical protein D1007_32244 [Hordeum vulgare]|nr:hypothetical protein D1007_32244 [Hordeum vulgare]
MPPLRIPWSIMSLVPALPSPSGRKSRISSFAVLQYRNLKEGDIYMSQYAGRMKLLTVGLAVIENDLTTQFLHGLDKCLDTIHVVLSDQELPFDTVLYLVVLPEESHAQRAEDSASVFAFPSSDRDESSGSSDRPTSDRAHSSPHHQHPPPGRGRDD